MAGGGTVVGKYYLTITPQFERGSFGGLQKELAKGVDARGAGEKTGESFSGGLTGKLSALTVAAGQVLGNVFTDAIGYVASFASEAVTASDATDKFKSTLNFAGIGTDQIEALTASCQRYADETVYDLSDIQGITAQLAANNVKDFDRLAEAAGNLNAVAGGNKDTFKSVGMVLTQTAGQGKLTTENFNQLADAIPGASGKIQEELQKMGAYTGNFRDAMAKGEITAEEFNQAILNLGFQDAAVEAATSASTMEGAMGNLEASIVNLLKNGFDLIKPVLTDVIGGLSEFIEAMADGLGGIADNPFFTTVVTALQDFGDRVLPVVSENFEYLSNLFSQMAEGAAPVLGELFGVLLDVLAKLVETVLPPFTGAIEALQPVFDLLMSVLSDIIAGFDEFANFLLDEIGPVLDAVVDLFYVAGPAIEQVFGGIWEWCKGIVEDVWPAIQQIIDGFMNAIKAIIETISALIKGDWEGVWQGICDFFGAIGEELLGIADAWFGSIYRNVIEPVLGWIKDLWESIWNGIKDFFENFWENCKNLVDGAINWVKDLISNILGTIRTNWENAWNTLKDFVGQAWENIKNAVSQGIDGVLGFIRDLPQNILNALGDLGSLLWNAGRSIIDGLLGGLKSAWDNVTGWISGIGDWIASHKGPIDYDRRLLVPAGEAIMEGLSKGLAGGFKGVRADVASMADEINKEIGTGIVPKVNYELNSNIRNPRSVAGDVYDGMSLAMSQNRDRQPIYLVMDGQVVAKVLSEPMDREWGMKAERMARTSTIAR